MTEEDTKVEIVVMKDPETMEEIQFDRKTYKELKKAHAKAVLAGDEQMTFEGFEFYTNYIKYMLEFLDDKLDA